MIRLVGCRRRAGSFGNMWDDWLKRVIGHNNSNTHTQVDPLEPRIKFGTPETHMLCTPS